jgi:hypothetical protein
MVDDNDAAPIATCAQVLILGTVQTVTAANRLFPHLCVNWCEVHQ